MSTKTIPKKPASSSKKAAPAQAKTPVSRLDPHEAVRKAARDAEQAVADSAKSAGLVNHP
jgi:hypothetical protein